MGGGAPCSHDLKAFASLPIRAALVSTGPPLYRLSRLLQTHSELAETRAELEQLADDILAIKMLMDEESALGANGAGRPVAQACGAALVLQGRRCRACGMASQAFTLLHAPRIAPAARAASHPLHATPPILPSNPLLPCSHFYPAGGTFDGFDSPSSYSAQQAASAAVEDEDDTLDVLQSLAALSRQLVQVRFAAWCGLSWIHCDPLGLVAEPGGTQPAACQLVQMRCAARVCWSLAAGEAGARLRCSAGGCSGVCSVHRSSGAGSGAGNVQA